MVKFNIYKIIPRKKWEKAEEIYGKVQGHGGHRNAERMY